MTFAKRLRELRTEYFHHLPGAVKKDVGADIERLVMRNYEAIAELAEAAHRLAMRSNRITAEFRHAGTMGTMYDAEEVLPEIYDAQCEVEEALKKLNGGEG